MKIQLFYKNNIMKYSSVIGLQFGDEGKGSMVSYLCSQSRNPLVVRFNGGHQAGHTVLYNGIRHTFSSFGSGTLQGVPTYWSKYCTFYPLAAYNEYLKLQTLGVKKPILYVDPLCPVTTPYDCFSNFLDEKENNHGSVGVGFGSTIKRHESHYKLYFQDLFNKKILRAKLQNIEKYYLNIYKEKLFGEDKKENLTELIDKWFNSIEELIQNDIISIDKMGMDFTYTNFDHIIFEGAQGVLLDMDFGFFPNVTRSNTTNKNVFQLIKDFKIIDEDNHDSLRIHYMTRCYQTRHGNGFMSNENMPPDLINTENEINLNGGFQGQFRKSILDLDLIHYALQCDNHVIENLNGFHIEKRLAITCLDQIKDKLKYTVNDEISETTDITSFCETIFNSNKNIELIYHGTSEGVFKKQYKHLPKLYSHI